jgi:AcrR family transcriptional regulator
VINKVWVGMARRIDHTAEELREMIVAMARKIIVEEGLQALSTRAIAKRIGYTAGTLYQHFKDINEIILHVNARTMQGLVDQMTACEGALMGEPGGRIHAYANAYIAYIRSNRNAWDAMFDYRRSPDDVVPEWYSSQIIKLISLVETCFERLASPSGTTTPNQAALMVWASVHSVCTLEGGGRLELIMLESLETLIHRLVDVHIHAFVLPRA